MVKNSKDGLVTVIEKHENEIFENWLQAKIETLSHRVELLNDVDIKKESKELFNLFLTALKSGNIANLDNAEWDHLKNYLNKVSQTRVKKGFTPTEMATLILTLKKPIFEALQQEYLESPEILAVEVWNSTALLDKLGIYVMEIYLKGREEIIKRQQIELLELSTPTIKLYQGILVVPLIGTLDSSRAQSIMENLLQKIVETDSSIAIIDITGVAAVDTLVAQHILKTVAATRLMGAECIISGVRPQIAQTMVHLGVSMKDVITKSNIADALELSLRKMGLSIQKEPGGIRV